MATDDINWTSFRKRIFIDKPISEVYTAWATQAIIEKWFLEKGHYFEKGHQRKPGELIKKGDDFKWKWNNWNFEEEGKILEANGEDRISFTFGKGGIVHIALEAVGSGTELTLTQDEIPSDEKSKKEIFVGCATGWTFWLANLKAFMEHGITLHATGLVQEETVDLVNS